MLILSIDGGGVRGMIAAKLIARLEAAHPGWLHNVDLLAGTSTGAIIALSLAYGLTPIDVVDFYRTRIPDVFYQSWWRRFATPWYAKYSIDYLREAVEEVFGETTVDALNRDVLIASYFLGQREPEFKRSRTVFYDRSDVGVRASDLALWSSAAPTYFPSVDRHIDGGVSANNATVCAMAYQEKQGTPLSEMRVLSLGTGRYPLVMEGGDRGLAYWGKNLVTPFVDGGVDVAHFQAQQFLEDEGTYHRLQPVINKEVEVDDVAQLDYLNEVADQVDLGPTLEWLTQQMGLST